MPSRRPRAQRILLAISLAACHRGAPVPQGDIAASLTVPPIDAHAQPFDPAALHGHPALVMFVTPTCPHCLVTLPRAAAAATAAGDPIVAVFVSGRADQAAGVVARTHFRGAALLDDGSLLRRYDVKAVPYAVVLGSDGRARDAFIGEQDESTFRDALADAR